MTSILNMSAGLMIFMYILSCIIIAIFTAWIASQKSRSALLWFFLGFFFGFIALLAVGLAPKNGENTAGYLIEILKSLKQGKLQNENKNDIPIAQNTGSTWYCKKCGTTNNIAEISCKDCGAYK